jgi:diguanylate cyclase (GGDEF)-like protein/PAS domain S-box-containing protein
MPLSEAGTEPRCVTNDSSIVATDWALRSMFDDSPVAQALVDPVDRGVIANDAFARLFGMSRVALRSFEPWSLVHPDDIGATADEAAALVSGRTDRIVAEHRYMRADGTVFHGRIAASVLRDEEENFKYMFVTILDVTAELAAAEALARSEARARALIDHSPDIIAILYPDGEWESTDQGTRLLGYPKGFDPEGGVFSLIHADDAAAASAALAEVLAGTRAADEPIELRLRCANETYRQFECVGQSLIDDPDIGGVVVNARDITARKHAERQIRRAEQRFAVAFAHAPIVMSVVDLDGRILDINPAGCALLGRSRDEMIGTLAELMLPPDDRAQAIERTTAQLTDPTLPVEFRVIAADGHLVPVISHAALVEPETPDETPYVLSLQTDISERKQLEAELHARALRDPLTGLYNRAGLHEHLARVLLQRRHGILAALFLDLDNLKTINDTFGHNTGDELLVYVARQITQQLHAGDLAARIGGDEFVVILDLPDEALACSISERLRTAIATGFRHKDQPIAVTASIGVAVAQPHDTETDLIERADTAAYIAKRNGKARLEPITNHQSDASARARVTFDGLRASSRRAWDADALS